MAKWTQWAAVVLVSAVVGTGSAVGTLYAAGGEIVDVHGKVEPAETDTVTKEALAAILTLVDKRMDAAEGRTFRLATGFACGGFDSVTVVTSDFRGQGIDLRARALDRSHRLSTAISPTSCTEHEVGALYADGEPLPRSPWGRG